MLQKLMQNMLLILLISLSFNAFSTTTDDFDFKEKEEVKEEIHFNEKGQIILETIQELQKSGYITEKNANEAKAELVFSKKEFIEENYSVDKTVIKNTDIEWGEYLSWINLLKILGIILVLVAFRGVILQFLVHLVKIPTILYQTLFLSATLSMTFIPEHIYAEQALYIGIFGVLANIIVIGWIVGTYQDFFEKIFKIFSLNLNPAIIGCFYLTLYFGFFSIHLDSQFLGIFSCIAFVGMFGFIFESTGIHTVMGYESDNYMGISLIINGLIILAYSLISIYEIDVPYISSFSVGIQYVCTIVFTVTLLIFSSFVCKNDNGFGLSVLLMIVAEGLALTGMYLFNLEVIPVIINTAFFLFVVGWIGYVTQQINGILMCFVMGIILYGSAIYIEKNPELFITALF